MGLDARIETGSGETIADISDPKSYVSWILGFADHDATACIRFIDPYGDTVFNRTQFETLLSELESIKPNLDHSGLELAKERYLNHAAAWPERAIKEAHFYASSVSLDEVCAHLNQLIGLVRQAIDQGPGHYVKFVGD